eukprot:11086794-Heterocapsa_arctica.AAC.1
MDGRRRRGADSRAPPPPARFARRLSDRAQTPHHPPARLAECPVLAHAPSPRVPAKTQTRLLNSIEPAAQPARAH